MAIDHPPDALPPGCRLGAYEILRVLGRGGFAFTYQARRVGRSGEMVAIKELFPVGLTYRAADRSVLPAPGTDSRDIAASIEMFLQEARLICSLDHPNIVRGVEAFRENCTGYLVMRYVSGKNLLDSLRSPGGFVATPTTIPALTASLADGLEVLHGRGLLHCDIKPDNIFLGVGFEPILIDLGSARWNAQDDRGHGVSTYSRYYSAIEQISDNFGSVGPWTDIYQLCAVLYRCISSGKMPDAQERAAPGADPFIPLAELAESGIYPRELIQAIDWGLNFHPRQRPTSVAQWRAAMGRLLRRGAPAPVPPRDWSPPSVTAGASAPATLVSSVPPQVPPPPAQNHGREYYPAEAPESYVPEDYQNPESPVNRVPDLLFIAAAGLALIIVLVLAVLLFHSCQGG